jgi:predicted O-methyltransferase YrrM
MQDRVTLLEGPAQDTLKTLQGTFDIVFVDADKGGYEGYVRTVLDRKLLSPNGIIICDNGKLKLFEEERKMTDLMLA